MVGRVEGPHIYRRKCCVLEREDCLYDCSEVRSGRGKGSGNEEVAGLHKSGFSK